MKIDSKSRRMLIETKRKENVKIRFFSLSSRDVRTVGKRNFIVFQSREEKTQIRFVNFEIRWATRRKKPSLSFPERSRFFFFREQLEKLWFSLGPRTILFGVTPTSTNDCRREAGKRKEEKSFSNVLIGRPSLSWIIKARRQNVNAVEIPFSSMSSLEKGTSSCFFRFVFIF